MRVLRLIFYIARYRLWLKLPKRSLLLRLLVLPLYLIPAKKQFATNQLADFFVTIGPIFIKFGQFLSVRPDILPKHITQDLELLTSNVATYSGDVAIQIIEQDLGKPITELFLDFDKNAVAGGSIAQVHKAKLISGESVAVKVIRPNIKKLISNNLKLIKLLVTLVHTFSAEAKRLKVKQLYSEYSYFIKLEADLKNEAANCQRLRSNFKDNKIHYSPKIYWQHSGAKVITMEWIQAIPVNAIDQIIKSNINIAELAEMGVKIFFIQVFEHNFFHADMHPGNIFVRAITTDKAQYIAVDCAVIGTHTKAELLHIALLLYKVFKRDYHGTAKVMAKAGWIDKQTNLMRLSALISKLFEPLAEQSIEHIAFSELLLELFNQSQEFNLQLPPSQLLLLKTLTNIEGLGKQLYPQLNLFAIAIPFLEKWLLSRFSPKQLAPIVAEELLWKISETG